MHTCLHFRECFTEANLFSSGDAKIYYVFNFVAKAFVKIAGKESLFTLYHLTKSSYHKNHYTIYEWFPVFCVDFSIFLKAKEDCSAQLAAKKTKPYFCDCLLNHLHETTLF